MTIKDQKRVGLHHNRNSLFFKVFLKMSCFTIILAFIICTIFFSVSLKLISSEFVSAASDNATMLDFRTDEIFSQVQDICNSLSLNESVRFFLLDSARYQTVTLIHDKITFQLSQYASISPYIDSIYVYNDNTKSIFSKEGYGTISKFDDVDWLTVYRENPSEFSITPRKMFSKFPYVITFIKKFKLNTGEKGAVILNLNTKHLFPELSSSDVTSYIVNKNNTILYSSNTDLFLENAAKNKQLISALKHGEASFYRINLRTPYAASVSKKNNYDISCVSIIDISDKASHIIAVQYIVPLFCIFLLLISIFVAYKFSLNYYTPFLQIKEILDNPVNFKSLKVNNAETQYITQKIIEIMNANEVLRKEIIKYTEQAAKLRIYTMQSQMNPHFLYNTMNIINLSLVKKLGMNDDSIEIINKLSSLMRYSMDLSSETTIVRTEIKYSKLYIDTLKIRAGENFIVKWDIDESISNAQIPKLCFQPLIENAFSHGLIPSNKEKKHLIISGKKDQDAMLFTIEDTGIGISKEKFIDIKDKLNSREISIDSGSHIGIKNVNDRIKLIFGEDYGVDIESTAGVGTKIFVRLPYIET